MFSRVWLPECECSFLSVVAPGECDSAMACMISSKNISVTVKEGMFPYLELSEHITRLSPFGSLENHNIAVLTAQASGFALLSIPQVGLETAHACLRASERTEHEQSYRLL